jgi:hypothetical protein
MPVQIQYQPDDICVFRISGILKRSEFGAEQNALARKINMRSKPTAVMTQAKRGKKGGVLIWIKTDL